MGEVPPHLHNSQPTQQWTHQSTNEEAQALLAIRCRLYKFSELVQGYLAYKKPPPRRTLQ